MLEEALAGARALVDPRRETTCLYCLGLIAHDQASLDLAEDFYERARALAVEQRDKGHEGVAALMLAVLALERDEPDRACALARVARDTLGDVDPATATIAQTYLAVALAAQGSASAAREALESARELARDRDDSAARAVCERLEAVVEWSEAREASRRAKHSRAERLLASAGARLRQQEAPSTVDLRIAHRVVERWLERESIAAPAREALVVATDGSWFSLRGGARISLTRHRSAQRLLAALAQQRVEKPGVGLSHAALVARGWPGQRILPSAAALRLRATIKQLRSLGLAEVLETLPGAYALRASVSIRLSEPTAHC
jgi:ATP/maltotriose-dependent transcriptional regulator MalT